MYAPNSTLYRAIAIPLEGTVGILSLCFSAAILLLQVRVLTKPIRVVFISITLVDMLNCLNTFPMLGMLGDLGHHQAAWTISINIQRLVLSSSLLLLSILCYFRFLSICFPQSVRHLASKWIVYTSPAFVMFLSLIEILMKEFKMEKIEVIGACARLVLIVGMCSMWGCMYLVLLRSKKKSQEMNVLRAMVKTTGLLTLAYIISHVFHFYVWVMQSLPDYINNGEWVTSNAATWVEFTAYENDTSTSLGHLSLLLQAMLNSIILIFNTDFNGTQSRASVVGHRISTIQPSSNFGRTTQTSIVNTA